MESELDETKEVDVLVELIVCNCFNNKSKYFKEAYEQALQDLTCPKWLTTQFVKSLNHDFGILENYLDDILIALEEILQNEELVLLAKTLYNMASLKKNPFEMFSDLDIPSSWKEKGLGYRLVLLFPVLGLIKEAYLSLRSRGLDKEMLLKTFSGIDSSIATSAKREGILAFNKLYFKWTLLYANGELLTIGRLQFQIIDRMKYPILIFSNKQGEIKIMMDNVNVHQSGNILGTAGYKDKEGSYIANITEEEDCYKGYCVDLDACLIQSKKTILQKTLWTPVFSNGDSAIEVHIPGGKGLREEECVQSFDMAREIYSRYFPEYNFKAFITITWLMSPELRHLLKPDSNILLFQKQFNVFPSEDSSGTAVFKYVYNKSVDSLENIDLNLLPENTSLMKKIKEHYKNGGHVNQFAGVFLF